MVSDLGELSVKPVAPVPVRTSHRQRTTSARSNPQLGERRPAVFLDYDGVLTPIVEHPDLAVLSDETRAVLTDLASVATVAVVSGRDVADVRGKVQVPGIYYAGSHGFDIITPSGEPVIDERLDRFQTYLAPLDAATEQLEDALRGRCPARRSSESGSLSPCTTAGSPTPTIRSSKRRFVPRPRPSRRCGWQPARRSSSSGPILIGTRVAPCGGCSVSSDSTV